jgi:hypothetical protein
MYSFKLGMPGFTKCMNSTAWRSKQVLLDLFLVLKEPLISVVTLF